MKSGGVDEWRLVRRITYDSGAEKDFSELVTSHSAAS